MNKVTVYTKYFFTTLVLHLSHTVIYLEGTCITYISYNTWIINVNKMHRHTHTVYKTNNLVFAAYVKPVI